MPFIAADYVLSKIIKRFEAIIMIDEIFSKDWSWSVDSTLALQDTTLRMMNINKDNGVSSIELREVWDLDNEPNSLIKDFYMKNDELKKAEESVIVWEHKTTI